MNVLATVLVFVTVALAVVGFTFLGLYLSKKFGPSKPLTEEEKLIASQVPQISPLPRPSHRPVIPLPTPKKSPSSPKTPSPGTPLLPIQPSFPDVTPSELSTELPSEDDLKSLEQSLRTRDILPSSKDFDLVSNGPFNFGESKFDVEVKTIFDNKFDSYTYTLQGNTFTPEKFVIYNEQQTGLPTDKSLNSVTVYLSHVIPRTPLLVALSYDNKEDFYTNSFNGGWFLAPKENLEERLEYLDSVSNCEITVNLARRSDYYRNGTGMSKFDPSKDVNVFVETDKPIAGWTTYTHKLFCSYRRRFMPFYPTKFIFASKEVDLDIPTKCEYIDIFFESERTTLLPPVILFKHKSSDKFYILKDDKYILSDAADKITHDNLEQKLKEISTQTQSSTSKSKL